MPTLNYNFTTAELGLKLFLIFLQLKTCFYKNSESSGNCRKSL